MKRSISLRTKIQKCFCAYFRGKWISLHQTNSEMIFGPFYTYHQVHLTTENT